MLSCAELHQTKRSPHCCDHGRCGLSGLEPVTDKDLYRLFGFLLGSTLAGASVYYYILEEYKVSNELLTEDIYVCRHQPAINLADHSAMRGDLSNGKHTLVA